MGAEAKTRKADKVAVNKELFEEIKKDLPVVNAKKLLNIFKELEEKLNRLYSTGYKTFLKIENKPFYFFSEGRFYIADPSRVECPNSGENPPAVEGVLTEYINYNQWEKICKYSSCPIFSGLDETGNIVVTNKDGKKYNSFVAYYDGYYKDVFYNRNSSQIGYVSNHNIASRFPNTRLRLPISSKTGF